MAPPRLAPERSAIDRLAPKREALVRLAPESLENMRSAWLRSAQERSAPERSASKKLAWRRSRLILGSRRRHSAIASAPRRTTSTCSGFAISPLLFACSGELRLASALWRPEGRLYGASPYSLRSSVFSTLPRGVFGSSGTKATYLGALKLARRPLQC